MLAIVVVKTSKVNLVVTEHSNIDWISKEVDDIGGLEELEFSSKSVIDIFDIESNGHLKISVLDLDESKHRLLLDKKMYVILHKSINY